MCRRRVILLSTAASLALLPGCQAPNRSMAGPPCCGPINEDGRRLAIFLDGTRVEELWQRGWHVNWLTGERDRPFPGGHEAATHCSAFAAAVGYRLGVYLLRPPEHPQELLANAQMRWLREQGASAGWRPVATAKEAQALANRGELVVAAFEAPDPHRPGHIAVLRPSLKSAEALTQEGPQVTQSGAVNYLSAPMALGFSHHPGAWMPGGGGTARFYAHRVDWAALPG